MVRKRAPMKCECGCGGMTKGGMFLPGHDARLKGRLRRAARRGDEGAARELQRRGWAVVNKTELVAILRDALDMLGLARTRFPPNQEEIVAMGLRIRRALGDVPEGGPDDTSRPLMPSDDSLLVRSGLSGDGPAVTRDEEETPDGVDEDNLDARVMVSEGILFSRRGAYPELDPEYQMAGGFFALGVRWPSIVHYFEASKSGDPNVQASIRESKTVAWARRKGEKVEPYDGWDSEEAMEEAIRAQLRHPVFGIILQDTGDAPLHWDSDNPYWGYAGGKGEDVYGMLLARYRTEIATEAALIRYRMGTDGTIEDVLHRLPEPPGASRGVSPLETGVQTVDLDEPDTDKLIF